MKANQDPILHWSAHTDVGRVRKNNEDSFLGLSIDAREVRYLGKIGETIDHSSDYVFAVSDGMGGANAGEYASQIAVEKITKMFPSFLKRLSSRSFEKEKDDSFFQLLKELFHEIHRALLFISSSYEECRGMGTTLSMIWMRPGKLYFAHVGDSRLYYVPKSGGIFQVTEDDTHVGWLFRQGKINERESKMHPARNLLQKVLGADHQFVTPQVGALSYIPGDHFLLCTDGVTDGMFDEQLLEIINAKTSKSFSEHLVDEAIERSGRDNATVVMVTVGKNFK